MRVGMPMSYSGGFAEAAAHISEFEAAGLDIAFVPEAYSFDAVSQLGYLAAKTSRVAERVAALAEAGVTTINASPVGADHASRLASVAALVELAG